MAVSLGATLGVGLILLAVLKWIPALSGSPPAPADRALDAIWPGLGGALRRLALAAGAIEFVTGLLLLHPRLRGHGAAATEGMAIAWLVILLQFDAIGASAGACGCFGSMDVSRALHYGIAMATLGTAHALRRSLAPSS